MTSLFIFFLFYGRVIVIVDSASFLIIHLLRSLKILKQFCYFIFLGNYTFYIRRQLIEIKLFVCYFLGAQSFRIFMS